MRKIEATKIRVGDTIVARLRVGHITALGRFISYGKDGQSHSIIAAEDVVDVEPYKPVIKTGTTFPGKRGIGFNLTYTVDVVLDNYLVARSNQGAKPEIFETSFVEEMLKETG